MIKYTMLSFLAFLVYLNIGILIYRLNKKSQVNRVFLFLCILMSIWSFAYSFAYLAEDVYEFSVWNKLSAIGWCNFSAVILYLSLAITESKLFVKKSIVFLVILPGPIFLYMCWFLFGPSIQTSHFIERLFYTGNFIYNFSYLLLSIILIGIWGIKSDNIRHKIQAKIVVISSVMPFLMNLLTQTLLPIVGVKGIPNIGQIYSLIMILGTFAAITKYRFLNIPVSDIADEILSEMVDLFIMLNPKGIIVKMNSQILKLSGYKPEELVGRHISYIVEYEPLKKVFEDNDVNKTVYKFSNVTLRTKNNESIPISISCSFMYDSRLKDLLGVLIIGQDIRKNKELELEIAKNKETAEMLKSANEKIEKMNQVLEETNQILMNTNANLHDKSIRDSLTNLYNHGHIYQTLENEIELIKTNNQFMSVMMLDIDHFKRINDKYGHQIGDEVLVAISDIIKKNIRSTDVIGRYGGEEFLVILPRTDVARASIIAERIRKSVEEFRMIDDNFKITVSIGLTQYEGNDASTIIKKADKLLYRGKENGRNRVEVG